MALDFTVKDVMHRVVVKFVHAFLPNAKKPYNLKAVHQQELDIHGIASKAEMYNIGISPMVIEEGLTAGMKLINYLVADGYRIKTPLFNLKIRVPGEYEGTETRLPDGVQPTVRLQTSAAFREYIRERVKVEFDGVDSSDGLIGEALDEATGLVDECATMGNIITLHGYGLKVEADDAHKGGIGLFFVGPSGDPIPARVLAVNAPRTLKALVPTGLSAGTEYSLRIVTQSSAKGHHMNKELRVVNSEFTLTAVN